MLKDESGGGGILNHYKFGNAPWGEVETVFNFRTHLALSSPFPSSLRRPHKLINIIFKENNTTGSG